MGAVSNEPSMEDILSSIKRIIADGSDRTASTRSLRRRASTRDDSELAGGDEDADMGLEAERSVQDDGEPTILELTDMVDEPAAAPAAVTPPRKTTRKDAPAPQTPEQAVPAPVGHEDVILSDISAQAARQSLSQLSSLLVRPQEGDSNTLEGLVREMLRPMLKEWLEAQLPDLVQAMVKKEIDRIVGRLG